MSLPSHKIDALLKEWKFGSKDLKFIKDRSDKLLITILIWNNLVNTFTAAFATVIATGIAESSWIEASVAVWVATWVITLLLLIFGEIAPKSFATKNAEKISLSVSKIYRFLMFVLTPIVYLLEKIIQIFTGKTKEEAVSESEIEAFIDMWKNSGWLEEKQHEHLKNVLEFGEITSEEIMTPRVNIEALSDDTTVGEALDFYLTHTHSRIPVYSKTIDKITHILTIRDLVSQKNKSKKLSELNLVKPIKVSLNQPIDNLLEDFQKSHKVIAIVIDEYGWVAWLVTLEDIIEEIFWEIRDETDKETEEIINKGTNIYDIEASVMFEDVLQLFNIEFKDLGLAEKEFDGETLSYFLTSKLERFPEKWESLQFEIIWEDIDEHLLLKVLEVSEWNIWKVEVRKVVEVIKKDE